jgi:hypothetical protein
MFAATADYAQRIREGKPLPEFMQTKKERAAAKAQS